MSDSEADLDLGDVFTTPPRPPSPEATVSTFIRDRSHLKVDPDESGNAKNTVKGEWEHITIRLVGSHPLWGHYLWNAARSLATYLDRHPELYIDRNVLELGAGGGLPSIVTALNGAQKVVVTDYPDAALVDNLRTNVDQNVPVDILPKVAVVGYVWGSSIQPLTEVHPTDPNATSSSDANTSFDLIILSDLIFNHSQHDALLSTCEKVIRADDCVHSSSPTSQACILVWYSHHRPRLAHRDLEFFSRAESRGWDCEEIVTQRFEPMFPEDPGDEEVRATVHGWKLVRSSTA